MRFAYFERPDRWSVILRRTLDDIREDNCFGLAAELAFYFLLALVPALLFLVALVGALPVNPIIDQWLAGIEPVAPKQVVDLVRNQLDEVASGGNTGLLTLGFLTALWSTSSAMTAIISTLNRAYDVEETRSWWKARLLGIGLTIAAATGILLASVLLIAGAPLLGWLGSFVGWSEGAVRAWQLARWPVVLLLIVFAVDLIYHVGPNIRREWVWITPGSLTATGLWLAGSFGFKAYVQEFGRFNATYGTLAGVVVLMLWFYVSALAILMGAELNAEIERMLRERGRRPAHEK